MRRHRKTRKELKKRNKKILLFCLLLTLTLSVGYAAFNTLISIDVSGTAKRTNFYISNTGNDETGDGTLENPYLTIQKAYNEASKVANIYIMNDISQSTTINMDKEKKITLTSYSTNNIIHSVIKTAAINWFTISQTKGTLNLENIVLEGNNIEDTRGGIYTSATLNINNGATIENFVSSNVGGGIYAEGVGTVTISGGTISGNSTTSTSGGGMYVKENIILIVSGGTISNNTSTNHGGGIYATGSGTVTISGTALIDGNRTTSASNANGGGVHVANGRIFNMTGGTISNNYCSFCGGGIILAGGVEHTISGGKIIGNEAVNNSGGILLSSNNTKLTMTGGEISNNIAGLAGGVYIYNGSTFEMNNGIIKNNISTYLGGGVEISRSSPGYFVKNGGIICENTPSNEYETHGTCPS